MASREYPSLTDTRLPDQIARTNGDSAGPPVSASSTSLRMHASTTGTCLTPRTRPLRPSGSTTAHGTTSSS